MRPWFVLACSVLFACKREEHRAEPDPAAAPVTSTSAAAHEIGEKELLGHLLDVYDKLEIKKATDVPAPSDRWAGTKIRLAGWVDSSGPGDEGKLVARLKDKESRSSVLWCRFDQGVTAIPKAGETVTVEGNYSVSTQWMWNLPLAYWNTTLRLEHCSVVTSK